MLESNRPGASKVHLNFMTSVDGGRRRRRVGVLVFGLFAALILGGCASKPILTYESDAAAQVLAPIRATGVTDGRARFREIFCERFDAIGPPADGRPSCSDYLHRLVDEPASNQEPVRARIPLQSVRFVFVPGYVGDAIPGGVRALGPSIDRLTGKGYRIEYIQVSGGGGGDYNANQIAAYFRERAFPEGEKLVVIGYSKGTLDLLHFLAANPDLARRVDAMVSYVGAVNGSPLAEVYPEFLINMSLALRGSDVGDKAGYRSLKPSVQMPWLASHPAPSDIKYFSFATFTDRENISVILTDGYDRLSQINPKNDGQLIFYDQILPGSTLLGYGNGDHWALAMPFTEKATGFASTFATRNVFPRDAMFEAVLLYVRENL
ncbi:MAG: hypothetical protein BMS9Abin01_2831 [Gammaproteobacteria bacterium]|nr:MAG: hypothetical protein BMS9Abin01_2831 [Gammaproteobacteria bacterium]